MPLPFDPSRPQTEDDIPMLAAIATERAYHQALEAGLSVLIARDGFIVEVSPDGTHRKIKPIGLPISVPHGQTFYLQ